MSAYKPGSVQQWTPLSSEEDKQTAFNNLSKKVVINDFKDTKTNERIDSLTKVIDIPEYSDTKLQFVLDPYSINKKVSFNYDYTDSWMSVDSMFIRDVLDPVNPQDAATKAYVDANAGGEAPRGSIYSSFGYKYTIEKATTRQNSVNAGSMVFVGANVNGDLETTQWLQVSSMDHDNNYNDMLQMMINNLNTADIEDFGYILFNGNATGTDNQGATNSYGIRKIIAVEADNGNDTFTFEFDPDPANADVIEQGVWTFTPDELDGTFEWFFTPWQLHAKQAAGASGPFTDVGGVMTSTQNIKLDSANMDVASGNINIFSGNITVSGGTVKGQTLQLLDGGSFMANATSYIDMGLARVQRVKDPTAAQDAATKNYVDTAVAGAGGSSGPFTKNGVEYETSSTLRTDGDSAFEMKGAGGLQIWGTSSLTMLSGSYTDFGSTTLARVGEPTQTHHAATKNYVDTEIAKVPTSPFADVGGIPTASGTIKAATLELSGDFKVPNGMTTLGSGGLTVADGDVAFNDGAITFSNNIDVTFTAAPITLDADTSFYTNANTDLVFGGARLKGVGEPTAGNDAATKSYVDTAVAGAGGGATLDGFMSQYYIGNFTCKATNGNPTIFANTGKEFVIDAVAAASTTEMYIKDGTDEFEMTARFMSRYNARVAILMNPVGNTDATKAPSLEGIAGGYSSMTGLTIANNTNGLGGGFGHDFVTDGEYEVYVMPLGGSMLNNATYPN